VFKSFADYNNMMMKLKKIKMFVLKIASYKKKIFLTFLASIITVIGIIPLLLKLKFVQNFFTVKEIEVHLAITSALLFLLVLTWKRMNRFFKRYVATKKLKSLPLNFVDITVIYILLLLPFIPLIKSLLKNVLPNIYKTYFNILIIPSEEFAIFFALNLFLIICFLFSYFYSHEDRVLNKKSKVDKEPESKPSGDNDKENRYINDPIIHSGQDLLNRKKFVADLSNQIKSIPINLTGSYTIGLNGSWGEGKTSILNLLEEKIKKSSEIMVIRFDPWNFENEGAIIKAFYNQLENAISNFFVVPDFKKVFSKYLKAFSTGVSVGGVSLGINSSDSSIEKMKEKVEGFITQLGKKVLIIIDDIDRLQPEEMMLVFKLVRNNLNFKNTIFLLSFDQSIVKKCLKDQIKTDAEFLDKIINMPISLPASEQEFIDEYLLKIIEELFSELDINEEEKKEFFAKFKRLYYQLEIQSLFKTLRLVKKYLNFLYFTLLSIQYEVNPLDFSLLGIIQLFNPVLYYDIRENRENYIELKHKTYSSEEIGKKKAILKILLKNEDKLLEDISKKILIELFPLHKYIIWPEPYKAYPIDYNVLKKEKRISHFDCFFIYFSRNTSSKEISNEYMQKLISSLKREQTQKQKKRINNILRRGIEKKRADQCLSRLGIHIEKIDSQLAFNIIQVIYENADRFEKGDNYLNSFEFTKAVDLMLLLLNKVDGTPKEDLIEMAVMNTPDFVFANHTILECKEKNIDIKKFARKFSQRLTDYFIDRNENIFTISENPFAWAKILAEWGTDWEGQERLVNENVQNYVLKWVKDDEKNFLYLVQEFSRELYLMLSQFPYNFYNFQKYFNIELFKEVALKFKDSESLTDDERLMLNKFLEFCTNEEAKKELENVQK